MRNSDSLRKWGALCGLLYVVLFVVGSIFIFDGPSSGENDSPAKFAAFYGKSSNRDKINIGWLLACLGLFFLIWFVATLRETTRKRLDSDTMLGSVVGIGGSIYIAVAMAAIGLADGIRTMSDDTYHHQVYSGIIHAANDGTYIMHVTGTAALAALIFAFSMFILKTRELPRWLGLFGIVAGVAALVSVFFFTMVIWLAWIAATSLVLFMHTSEIDHTTAGSALT